MILATPTHREHPPSRVPPASGNQITAGRELVAATCSSKITAPLAVTTWRKACCGARDGGACVRSRWAESTSDQGNVALNAPGNATGSKSAPKPRPIRTRGPGGGKAAASSKAPRAGSPAASSQQLELDFDEEYAIQLQEQENLIATTQQLQEEASLQMAYALSGKRVTRSKVKTISSA